MRAAHRVLVSAGALGVVLVAAAAAGCGTITVPGTADGGPNNEAGVDAADGAVPLDCTTDGGHPVALGCTGLYSDWPSRTISPDAIAYTPGVEMWADKAESSRWIMIPAGQQIDTSDQNNWKFPVGTKIWQERRLLQKPIETRFLAKLGPQLWFRTTYEWNEAGTTANEITYGDRNVRGLGYDVPSTDNCATCHAGRGDFVLGFEIVGLASPQANGLTLDQLIARNLLSAPPTAKPAIPGDPLAVAAYAFLHANCGIACHNRSASAHAASTGLFMRLDVGATGALPSDATQVDVFKTAVGVASIFQPPGSQPGTYSRVKAHDATLSAIVYRAAHRDASQMPPIDTHLVDELDVKKVTDWVNALPP